MTPLTLQEQLCLNRPNFQINPKQSFVDASLYFGKERNEEIIGNIQRGYSAGYVPRMYLYGSYGSGKTHLLYHLKHHFDHSSDPPKVIPLVVQIEAEGKTRYQSLHKRFMEAIGIDRVEQAYMKYRFAGEDPETRFQELFPDPNTYLVMQLLNAGPATKPLAWRWLTGEITVREQSQLGVTSSPTDTGTLVDILVTIGELFKRTGQNLLFLVDESEALEVVSNPDARRSWHDAFRRLADTNDNQSVGWILAFYITLQAQGPEFMMEGDIITRLGKGGQYVLPALAPVEVRKFVLELLDAFVDKERAQQVIAAEKLDAAIGTYPFTDDGLKAFVQHASAAQENAIPRTILRALTACALEALRKKKRAIDKSMADAVVPAEFAELG